MRRLPAVETLGSATVICTDKTGTLTENEMTVQRIWLPSGLLAVTGAGYDPTGFFEADGNRIDPGARPGLMELLETGTRCNSARLYKDENGWHKVGEPTEAALLVAGRKAGLHPEGPFEAVGEFSFTSERKRMTVVERKDGALTAHIKGAPEVIIARSARVLDGGDERAMTEAERHSAEAAYEAMSGEGLRTLALARRTLPDEDVPDEDEVEKGLTLLGIVGIIDPPRPEVPGAVRLAYGAGIGVIMITGDSPSTALAVARQTGLRSARAVTGPEMEGMDDETLGRALAEEAVFARTAPEHKLRIVTLLKKMGHIVGMTGDGVNDSPALKKADIGIAMGLRGTDVAREAADMVLTDDNFASIVGAVEEGRRQYDNVQKFVRYLLSSNTGEVLAILVNILAGGPLILLPAQILWMNLVTDGMTAVALGLEPPEKSLMMRPPRRPAEPILNATGAGTILLLGAYIGGVTLWVFHHYGGAEGSVVAQTAAFTGIIILEQINVFNFRALGEPIIGRGLFSNPWVLLACAASLGLQAGAVYLPFMQKAFHTVPLALSDWAVLFALSVPAFFATEAVKWLLRRKGR